MKVGESGNGISRHFKREAKFMFGLIAGVFVLALLAAAILPWVFDFVRSDRCLDRGGSFNYQTGKCEFASGSPERR